jgi:hypothetical protein
MAVLIMSKKTTYSVIRNHKDGESFFDTVEASGLSWEAAKQRKAQLDKQEHERLGEMYSSWTADVFFCRMDICMDK